MSVAESRKSWLGAFSDWLDRGVVFISERLNPILVKETRQALKSRQFIATFMLILIASWLVSVFGLVWAGPGVEHQVLGPRFFTSFYVVLSLAIFIVVPFGAFRSLLSERDQQTYEVLSISTLKPRQIVWGKLLSALVQLFIYYSALTPFLAFTSLLRGIDVPTIAYLLVLSLLCSLGLSMITLTISTIAGQRHWQALLTLLVLGGLLMACMYSITATAYSVNRSLPFNTREFWLSTGVMLSYYVAYFLLLLQIAIAQLTFEADNRSTGVRLASAGIGVMSLVWLLLVLYVDHSAPTTTISPGTLRDSQYGSLTRFLALHWAAIGLFFVSEADLLSRRVRRTLPRRKIWRAVLAPLLPGGARGFGFVLMNLVGAWLVLLLSYTAFNHKAPWGSTIGAVLYTLCQDVRAALAGEMGSYPIFLTGTFCYVLVYLGIAAVLGRWGRNLSSDFRPAHARVITVLIAAVAAVLPHFLSLSNQFNSPAAYPFQAVIFIADPFHTLESLDRGTADYWMILFVLGIAALLATLLNATAVLRNFSQILFNPQPVPGPEPALSPVPPVPAPVEAGQPESQLSSSS